MAHWAEIDENNVVLRVVVGDNNDPNNDEGYQWLLDNLGGTWIKTSYNGNIRKNYAGIGFTYDLERDAFLPPKPFESWVLNEETCQWESPTPAPTDGLTYFWNEAELDWQLQDFSEPDEAIES
jgi:hypothetical protein